MRISDWSSDVCSSDLRENAWPEGHLDFARCERVGRAYGLYRSKTVVPRNSRRGAEIAEKIVYAEARSRGEAGSGRQARVPLRRCGILQCFRKKAAWRRAFLSASPREPLTRPLSTPLRPCHIGRYACMGPM